MGTEVLHKADFHIYDANTATTLAAAYSAIIVPLGSDPSRMSCLI
ncbi:hypothetical protein AGR9A_Lc40560 [Agrobacterium salinitolerans str. Hayward 0363]|nr:hypothetical protein AGR9A_Lc40560 [Agrobacterium salinitolerans str. Hayward 0363]